MKIPIKELYEFVCHLNDTTGEVEELITIELDGIKVKDEKGDYIPIISSIRKRDTITDITLDDITIKTANKHLICIDGINCKNVKDLQVGDYIWRNDKKVIIKDITRGNIIEDVYDIGVNSETHLFQTSDGVVHHNTSSIEQFADIIGMKIITIEAPHVSEDAIISVPYLVKTGMNTEKKTMEMKEDKNAAMGFEVVTAESSLITDLKNKKPMKQAEWDKAVNRYAHIAKIREDYRKPIDKIRGTYNTILFLDEFYRTGSKRIQNLFRTILNGYLGDTPIPKNIYIIFASNMDNTDGSLDEVPLNHQFSAVNFDTPNKEDFMAYIGSKFAGSEGNENEAVVKPEVFNKFMEHLSDDDMGDKDEETGIRVSPRRWEEIIKYISNGIPPKNLKEAEALVQFVYTNMKDYKEGTQSSKTEKYAQLVRDLVKENSEFDVSHVSAPKGTDWENLFESQIRTKMALGSDRKYVASLSGKPGVGKTSTMRRLAEDMGAKLIEIDCATLNSEDVVGLTTPNKNENGVMQTKFTAPPLWSKIMDQYDPTISIPGSSYTHILFLDEITRASKRVMNSIRSLMLEKKVNANYAIPDDMMIVTAMNPTDTGTCLAYEQEVDINILDDKLLSIIKELN